MRAPWPKPELMTCTFLRTISRMLDGEAISKTFPIKIPVSWGKSEDALVVQFLLYRAGYPLEQDGAFGPGSRKRLRAFQSAEFGWVDGVCSPGPSGKTINRLVERYLEYAYREGIRPDPRKAPPSAELVRAAEQREPAAPRPRTGLAAPAPARMLDGATAVEKARACRMERQKLQRAYHTARAAGGTVT